MTSIHRLRRHAGVAALVAIWPLVATAVPVSARAQSPPIAADSLVLTLRAAQQLAIRQSPVFLAAQQERAIARAQLRQARLLPFNPEVSTVVPTGSGGVPAELALTQEVEIGGQRGLRSAAAQSAVARADATVLEAARIMLADVNSAFFETVAAERRREIAVASLQLNQRLLDAVRIQVREGEVSVLEANLAEIELGRARARLSQGQRELAVAQQELKRLLGLPPLPDVALAADSSLAGVGRAGDLASSESLDSLIATALRQRPDVTARAAAIQELQSLTALARREAIPNLRAGVVTERENNESGTGLGVTLGMAVPLFNRNQGLVERRRAELRQAAFEARATDLRVRAEVASAFRTLQAAEEELAAFTESVLQPARDNSALLESAYRAGKITLPTLLLLRSQLFEAELGYWAAWVARNEARTRLDAATGALLTDNTLLNGPFMDRGTTP